MALYFPFALYTQVLLSETLFITLLLGGFLALSQGFRVQNEFRVQRVQKLKAQTPRGHPKLKTRPFTLSSCHLVTLS